MRESGGAGEVRWAAITFFRKPSKQPHHPAPSRGQTRPPLVCTRPRVGARGGPACVYIHVHTGMHTSRLPLLMRRPPTHPPLPAAALSPGQPLGGGLQDPFTPVALLAPPPSLVSASQPPFRLQPLSSLERGPVAGSPVLFFPLRLPFSRSFLLLPAPKPPALSGLPHPRGEVPS